jgi:molybdenum cofactor guanylyltransferase
MSTVPVNGFILAGGKSSRMGRDKALLDWHGRPLVSHMIHILEDVTDQVQVVGRDPLPDRVPGHGPLSGIATALEVSPTDANLILAVDLPFLTKDFLLYFRSQIERSSRRLIACKIGSYFPLCLGVRKALLPEIERLLSSEDRSLHGWIAGSDAEILAEPQLQSTGFDAAMFRNLNTPEDYERGISGTQPRISPDGPSSVPGVR